MLTVGIDAGSRTIKIVIFDAEARSIIDGLVIDQGIKQGQLALNLLDKILAANNIQKDKVSRIVATGYGRNLIHFAEKTVTEITCQAAGIKHFMPDAVSIIDIGGQDSKYIQLDPNGNVHNFAMNDRCAAGTGRFLEVVATRLDLELEAFGNLAAASKSAAIISSMCVVFAETEIVSLLAEGVAAADIASGVMRAIASRVVAMAGGNVSEPIVFTGGVALVPGMAEAIEAVSSKSVCIAPSAQLTAALGAAIIAAK